MQRIRQCSRVIAGIGLGLWMNTTILSYASAQWVNRQVLSLVAPHNHAPDGIKWWGGATPEDPRIGVAFLLINFFVLLWILNRLIFRPLSARNQERSDRIRSELEAATKSRAEADQILEESRNRLQQLQKEVEQIKNEAQKVAERARAKILEEARVEAENIRASARENIEREIAVARQQLEADILRQAIERAEQVITQKFVQADQDRLLETYIKELGDLSLVNQKSPNERVSSSDQGNVQ